MAKSPGNEDQAPEQYDDIDKAIAQALDQLPPVNRGPYTTQARIEKHLDRIVYANRALGWSYARIADEVLSPQGVRISANLLRVYMQRFLKQREATLEATPKQPRRVPREHRQATPEATTQATQKQSVKQREPATSDVTITPVEMNEPGRTTPQPTPAHAAVRRATART